MANTYTLTLKDARIRDGKKESSFEVKVGATVIGGLSVLGYDDDPVTGETAEQVRDKMVKQKLKKIAPKLLRKADLVPPEEDHPSMGTSLTITDDELKTFED